MYHYHKHMHIKYWLIGTYIAAKIVLSACMIYTSYSMQYDKPDILWSRTSWIKYSITPCKYVIFLPLTLQLHHNLIQKVGVPSSSSVVVISSIKQNGMDIRMTLS